jgi:hypothetical protein
LKPAAVGKIKKKDKVNQGSKVNKKFRPRKLTRDVKTHPNYPTSIRIVAAIIMRYKGVTQGCRHEKFGAFQNKKAVI